MVMGIDRLRADLSSPRLGVTGPGAPEVPGAYQRLIHGLFELADEPVLLEPLAAAWSERSFEKSFVRPLLLLAALRFRALAEPDHTLAFELLMDAKAPELTTRLRDALGDEGLIPVLRERSLQTNEPGRAFAWGLTALTLGLGHRDFDLVDLGCSAGLNLVVDRTPLPYRFGTHRVNGFDFPSPERRVGLDRQPIDIRDPVEARWLEACIWPGQSERLARFKACKALLTASWPGEAPAPELRAHELGRGETLGALSALAAAGRPILAWESVVSAYLSEDQRSSHQAGMWDFLAAARDRVWAVLDPVGEKTTSATPMTLTVHLVRGGERHAVALAQSSYHTSSCLVVPGGPKRLAELWSAP